VRNGSKKNKVVGPELEHSGGLGVEVPALPVWAVSFLDTIDGLVYKLVDCPLTCLELLTFYGRGGVHQGGAKAVEYGYNHGAATGCADPERHAA